MEKLKNLLLQPHWQAMALAGTTGLSQVITAVMSLLVARSVTPSTFGVASAVMGLGIVVCGLVDFGSNEYWVREFARDRDRGSEMYQRLATKMVLSAILCLPLLASGFFLEGSIVWTLGLTMLFLQFEQTMQTASRGAARAPIVSLTMLADRIAALAAVFVLAIVGMGVERLLVALAVGNLVGGLLLVPDVRRLVPDRAFRWRNPWKGAFHYGVFSLSTSVQSLDVPLLGAVGGSFAAGQYGAVNRWTAPLQLLIGAFAQSSIPFVAGSKDMRSGWKAIRKGAPMLIAAFVCMIVLVVFAPQLTSLLLGAQYAGSAPVLRCLAIATGLIIFNQPMAMLMQATGRDSAAALAILLGVLVQLVLVALLAGPHGAVGAALGSIAGQLVMTLILWRGVRMVLKEERRPRRALVE